MEAAGEVARGGGTAADRGEPRLLRRNIAIKVVTSALEATGDRRPAEGEGGGLDGVMREIRTIELRCIRIYVGSIFGGEGGGVTRRRMQEQIESRRSDETKADAETEAEDDGSEASLRLALSLRPALRSAVRLA